VRCTVNAEVGFESYPLTSSTKSKKVLIIGGGPAGMECALVAAQRGHEVALIEKSNRLGGQLLAASTPAYKRQEFEALNEYYRFMLSKLGVKVLLNTEIKTKLPDDQRADVVVLALGAVPHSGKFEKNGKVISAFDVLMNRGKGVGNNVVVIGASGVGIDVALFLMEKEGRKVTVVEMLDEVGGDVNEFLKRHTLGMAEQKGITFLTNSEVVGVDKGKVQIKTLLGNKNLKCDTVVSAVGFCSRKSHPLKEVLEKKGAQVFVIGSAIEPGKLFEATQSGFWTAIEI
jgi:NADPH-dependent 2,4-dienoyl-CoA reductase/sulfur reductase-like enzyme